ncbi:unnamed protein product [Bursaphelenchus xylophilus]|uniref:RNA helicase n=1 Tax=Bursaphelenchus xylophilus TaxID=6326 RepID=A0A1I7RP28_BURXY|nr:unnamed protein product [Bursaphelenchus xylophilus]CAG9124487.1 unnamed protein product [Bursaphelenchus xylophilus]
MLHVGDGSNTFKRSGIGGVLKALDSDSSSKGERTPPGSVGYIRNRTFFTAAEQVANGRYEDEDRIKTGAAFKAQREIDEQDVMIIGSKDIKKPMKRFKDLEWPLALLENITDSFPDGPTVVQSYAIPYINDPGAGDLLLRSHTGSGKTAAFMIPIINNIAKLKREKKLPPRSPIAVVLVPTRELAIQVAKEGGKLARGTGINICFLIGAIPNSDIRINVERHGCDIIVGTLGKISHFLLDKESSKEGGKAFFSPDHIRYLVLDEADRLLSSEEARTIVDNIKDSMSMRTNYQVIMNSATLSVHEYDDYLLFMPTAITVGQNFPVDSVIQRFVNVSEYPIKNVPDEFRLIQPGIAWRVQKIDFLLNLCHSWKSRNISFPKVIIFVNTKRKAEFVAAALLQRDFRALAMHGDYPLAQRHETINALKDEKIDIIVGTDVISRGLNVPNVDVVVNYDMPVRRAEEYVHRIGRTGRMGNVGRAISFYDPSTDFVMAQMVEKIMLKTNQEVPEYLSYSITAQCDTFLSQALLTGMERPAASLLDSNHVSAWRFIADEAVVQFI